VLQESTVIGMIDMLHSVVEHGTARRARIPGVNVAGKTGTTNAYKDAWFVGMTGNYTAAVWLGNDDYESTNRLTGGILPAETFQKYMRVAMAYEEPKPLLGLPPPPPPEETEGAAVADAGEAPPPFDPGASGRLQPETAAALTRLEGRFKEAAGAPMRQAALAPAGAGGQ
jgi:penicillin-binding protein 1A